jgi:hypothetical protein
MDWSLAIALLLFALIVCVSIANCVIMARVAIFINNNKKLSDQKVQDWLLVGEICAIVALGSTVINLFYLTCSCIDRLNESALSNNMEGCMCLCIIGNITVNILITYYMFYYRNSSSPDQSLLPLHFWILFGVNLIILFWSVVMFVLGSSYYESAVKRERLINTENSRAKLRR